MAKDSRLFPKARGSLPKLGNMASERGFQRAFGMPIPTLHKRSRTRFDGFWGSRQGEGFRARILGGLRLGGYVSSERGLRRPIPTFINALGRVLMVSGGRDKESAFRLALPEFEERRASTNKFLICELVQVIISIDNLEYKKRARPFLLFRSLLRP